MDQMITEITICLGSSCFARGNKKTVRMIQDFLEDHNLKDRVRFKGNHCFGMCSQGPILKINDRIYEKVSENEVLKLISQHLEKIK